MVYLTCRLWIVRRYVVCIAVLCNNLVSDNKLIKYSRQHHSRITILQKCETGNTNRTGKTHALLHTYYELKLLIQP